MAGALSVSWMDVSQAALIAVAAMMAMAALHKILQAVNGTAGWHPVALRFRMSDSRARMLFAAFGVVDGSVAVASVAGARSGLYVAGALVVLYSSLGLAATRRSGEPRSCDCFLGGFAEATSDLTLIARGSAMLLLVAVGSVATAPLQPVAAVIASMILIVLHFAIRAADVTVTRRRRIQWSTR